MENYTEQQIGLFITGRNPGFEKFVKINWSGDEPGDVDNKTGAFAGFHNPVDPKAAYFGSELGRLFTTYECTLPNFMGKDGRISDFRYYLRIPADYQIETPEGSLCSPFYLLNEVRKLVEGSTLKDAGGFWKIDLGNGFVPQWDTEGMKTILSQFRLKHTWGETCKNSSQPGNPGFDTSDPEFYGMHVNSLPFMPINSNFSKIYFGKIPATENIIRFGSGMALPPVSLHVRQSNGTPRPYTLTDTPTVISSADLGYPVSSFEEIKVSLTAADVLDAYNNNNALALPEGASYTMDEVLGSITLEIVPKPLVRKINIAVSGISNSDFSTFLSELTFNGQPVTKQKVLTGSEIEDFIEQVSLTGFSKRFQLKADSEFIFKNALFKDDTIYITADKTKPRRNEPTAPHPSAGGSQPGTTIVKIILPADEKQGKYPVTVMQETVDQTDMCFMSSIEFKAQENNEITGILCLPVDSTREISVEVGAPAKYESGQISFDVNAGYYHVAFSSKSSRNIISRFMSTFGFKEEPFMSVGFRACRWLLVILVLFWVFIGGCIAGAFSTPLYEMINGENPANMNNPEHSGVQIVPVDSEMVEDSDNEDESAVPDITDEETEEEPSVAEDDDMRNKSILK